MPGGVEAHALGETANDTPAGVIGEAGGRHLPGLGQFLLDRHLTVRQYDGIQIRAPGRAARQAQERPRQQRTTGEEQTKTTHKRESCSSLFMTRSRWRLATTSAGMFLGRSMVVWQS